jgi:hypothetical protein
MLNASVDRFLKIFILGHDMLKVGGDQGLSNKPVLIKSGHGLLLTPGERADIVFVPRTEKVELVTELDVRGTQKVVADSCGNLEISNQISYNTETANLVTFITREESEQKLEVPLQLEPVRKILVDQCTPVIPVVYGNYLCEDELVYYAFREKGQGILYDSLTPKQAPLVISDGIYIIEVSNYSDLDNNFHLHGFSFQHIDTVTVTRSGKTISPNLIVENKDTIVIPARAEFSEPAKTVVRLAVEFKSKHRDIIAYGGPNSTKTKSGGWIFQSHLLTNEELGQAGYIQIVSECYREKFLDCSVNTYSEYFTETHEACLTYSGKNDWSNSYSGYSQSGDHSSKSSQDLSVSEIESLTQSIIVCSCGIGLPSHLCDCDTELIS